MGTVLIHRSMAAIADAASKDESRRSITGVHLTVCENGQAQIEATDGKALIRVTAKDTPKLTDFPIIEGFSVSENGTAEGIIPADAWKRFFKGANFPKRSFALPILQHAAVTMADGQAVLAATDLASPTVTRATMIDGSYPRTDSVFPTEEPVATIYFDPALLAATLASVVKMTQDGRELLRAQIDFYGPDKAIKITADNSTEGYTVTALVMPVR
jgi:DNA polymerase III sliding clamp (beta) subunit (PCNA family)